MSLKIMTADDSASLRNMVRYTLEENGYDVVEAEDGEDAYQKLCQESVHLLITDLNMPRLDGIGLIEKARELPSMQGVPIVMLSTESSEDKKMAGKKAGATGWIVKPFQPDQLIQVIKKLTR